jgi:hypothetical protein
MILHHVLTTDCHHQGDSYWETRRNVTPVTVLSILKLEALSPSIKIMILFLKKHIFNVTFATFNETLRVTTITRLGQLSLISTWLYCSLAYVMSSVRFTKITMASLYYSIRFRRTKWLWNLQITRNITAQLLLTTNITNRLMFIWN